MDIVLIDLDSFLPRSGWRDFLKDDEDAYIKASERDYIEEDNSCLVKVLTNLLNGNVLFITSRREKYRQVTEEWMWRNGIYNGLIMQPDDHTGDIQEWKGSQLKEGYIPLFAVDNYPIPGFDTIEPHSFDLYSLIMSKLKNTH